MSPERRNEQMRTAKKDRQQCFRCGRGIPPRRRDTGYCSNKCYEQQQHADKESAESEAEAQIEAQVMRELQPMRDGALAAKRITADDLNAIVDA